MGILKHGMCALLWMGVLVWPTLASAQDAPGRGTLTLIVRAPDGAPLAGVTLAVFHDTDRDGRVLVTTTTTAPDGSIRLLDLAWGLYIIQFQGAAPDGRPMLPPEEQNLGMLEDGNGIDGGFGVRFAEAERTELYVLGQVPGVRHAVPMFDMAPSLADLPQPYDPIVALANAGPTPTPFLLRDVVNGTLDSAGRPIPRGRMDGWCLAGLGLVLWGLALLIGVGWWRSRPVHMRKEIADGYDRTPDSPGDL